jgi:uncharacterized protein DUF1876
MDAASRWTVTIFIDENEGRTRAQARLKTRDNEIEAVGYAQCNPIDRDIPEIGEELAVARALSALAHDLLDLTASDIEAVTHQRAALKTDL